MSASLAAASVQSPSAPQWTLLCVDDEPDILSSLKRLFRPQGYRTLTAQSAADALALLEREQIDLVISDMRMPQMTARTGRSCWTTRLGSDPALSPGRSGGQNGV